ncbi:unnamed protein product [Bemisia tabaci]|uniref:Prolyl 4-hydroxylase alpha subunit domain-containing protein n=2 Tax=Bemisia tabaci TaxID=7038 RepID=A0A9P0F6F6_BEMTA|nr:unnamed protein product [Bemisia tabaci]
MMEKIILYILVTCGFFWPSVKAQISPEELATLQDYRAIDEILLSYLRNVIIILESKIDYIYFLRDSLTGYNHLKLDPQYYSKDALQNFKLAKRFMYQWKLIHRSVRDNPIERLDDRYRQLLTKYAFPSMTDLRNVAMDYLHIQIRRNIPTVDLASGTFLGAKHKTTLRGSDCHMLASYGVYDPDKRNIALEWLREAVARLDEDIEWKEYQHKLVLDYAHVLLETGYTREAAEFTKAMSKMAESSDFYFIDTHLYFKARNENLSVPKIGEHISPGETSLLRSLEVPPRTFYLEKICAREYTLNPNYVAKLKCRYSTRGSPLFVLNPLKEEELFLEPKVSIYRQFLTDSEVNLIIDKAHGRMHDSGVRVNPSETGHQTVYRTSKTFFIMENKTGLDYLLHRTDQLAGLSGETAEDLQVTYYDAGGFYTSHYDAFPFDFELPNGNRIATVLFYLNSNPVGGETAFYVLNVLVEPEKGSALVWDNLWRNGRIHMWSGHGACPVLHGHKWIATRWYHLRGQMLKRPCTLNEEE